MLELRDLFINLTLLHCTHSHWSAAMKPPSVKYMCGVSNRVQWELIELIWALFLLAAGRRASVLACWWATIDEAAAFAELQGNCREQANVCNVWYHWRECVCASVWVHVGSCCVWSDLKSFGRGLKKSAFERKWGGSNGRLSCAPRSSSGTSDPGMISCRNVLDAPENTACLNKSGAEAGRGGSEGLFFLFSLFQSWSEWSFISVNHLLQKPTLRRLSLVTHTLSRCLYSPFLL